MAYNLSVRNEGTTYHLNISGELDCHVIPVLKAALISATHTGAETLIIHLDQVTNLLPEVASKLVEEDTHLSSLQKNRKLIYLSTNPAIRQILAKADRTNRTPIYSAIEEMIKSEQNRARKHQKEELTQAMAILKEGIKSSNSKLTAYYLQEKSCHLFWAEGILDVYSQPTLRSLIDSMFSLKYKVGDNIEFHIEPVNFLETDGSEHYSPGLSEVDSSGLGLFIYALKRARSMDRHVKVSIYTNQKIAHLFQVTGLDRLFTIVYP